MPPNRLQEPKPHRWSLAQRRVRRLLPAVTLASLAMPACATGAASRQPDTGPARVGPANGALIVAGGGRLGPEIMERFVELAGGEDARIVIIPTAGERDEFSDGYSGYELLRGAGAHDLTVLHTRDPAVANTDSFVAPLRAATGIWIPGGRQWRLADAYLDTKVLDELRALLDRGGVIGGTSAGASIQPSFMVRGAVEGNAIMMAPGHERGFGLLRDVAVDQHLLARNRQDDLLEVVAAHPRLLGIGLDEGTAILVRGDSAEVIGRSRAAFYNTSEDVETPYFFLEPGDVFDLAERRVMRGRAIPALNEEERAVAGAVRGLFDAMRAADTTRIRAAFHPEARLFSTSQGGGSSSMLRVMTVDDFVHAIAASPERADERMIAPDVRIDGDIATVWTYYDFRSGDRFSHCGTDAAHLARTDGGWKILQITWTVRTDGCR
ncbi:MAG: Type 1 glutamine amidotransferase-like domain-containing protein [Longimicrobiales bacterium]